MGPTLDVSWLAVFPLWGRLAPRLGQPACVERSNNFDGLRLLGALSVFTSHQVSTFGHPQPTIYTGYSLGLTAVMGFFAISGYLVSGSWLSDPDLRRFANRRGLRILPAYWAVVLLAPLLVWTFTPLTQAWLRISAYWPHVVFQGVDYSFFDDNPYPGLNGSLWSIKFEILCYLLLAAFGVLLRRRLGAGAALLLLGGIGMLLLAGGEAAIRSRWAQSDFGTLLFMGSFFAAGTVFRSFPVLTSAWVTAPLVVLGVSLTYCGQNYLGVLATIPALVVLIGTRSWPVLRSAGRFGDFSYGIFLWGAPLQQLVFALYGRSTNVAVVALSSVALTLAAAALSWHLLERPSLRLKPRRHTATPAAGAVPLVDGGNRPDRSAQGA